MLIINNLKFAKNDNEFVSSLFDQSGTASGYYEIKRRGQSVCVHLMNMQKEILGAVISNAQGFKGVVNARRLESGKVFYQHAASAMLEEYLGVPDKLSHRAQHVEEILSQINQ